MTLPEDLSYDEMKKRLEIAESALEAIRMGTMDDRILGNRDMQMARLAEFEAREAHLKQVLMAKNENRRRLESLMLAIPAPVYFKDRNGRYLGCNHAFETITGRTNADIRGKTVHDLWPSDYGETYRDKDIELLENGGKQQYEFKLPGADGDERSVVFYKSAFYDDNGNIDGLVGVILDITEMKQRDEQITLLGHMLDEAPASITVHDTEGRFLYANHMTFSLHGYSKDEFMTINLHELDVPESEALLAERFALIAEKGYASFEVEHYRKDGTTFPLRVLAKQVSWVEQPAVLSIASDITERKQAEEALRRSEEILNYAQEIAGIGSYVWNIVDDSLEWSRQMFVIAGLDPEEFPKNLSNTITEMIHPEDRDIVFSEVRQMVKQGKTWPIEFRLIRTDGNVRWLRSASRFEFNETGKPILCIGVHHDITDQKNIRDARIESEKKYRLLADNTIDCIWMLDQDLVFTYINPAIYHMTGYTVEEWIGTNLRDHCDAEHFKTMENAVRSIFEMLPDNRGIVFESVMLKKNGEPFNVEISGRLLLDEAGGPIMLQGVTRDITERKQAEEALRQSEERMRAIFNAATNVSFIVTDVDEAAPKILEFSPGAENIFGYSREEIIGQPVSVLHIPEDVKELSKVHEVMSAGKKGFGGKTTLVRKSGEQFTALLATYPLFDRDGRMNAGLGVALDISKQEELQSMLNQVLKMESVGRLAGGVAHDFNNMLSVIIGHTELVMDSMEEGAGFYHDLSQIRAAAERAADLTRQLLAFARKQTTAPKVLNLNNTVGKMLRMLGRLIGENIDLSLVPGEDLHSVKIDPSQLDQILTNLCVNARDAISRDGRITIETSNITIDEVSCSEHADLVPGDFVLLAVSDNGCGMNREIIANIFDPFFTTKKTGQGTGLGLSTVYGIVKQNKGSITVYSKPDRGTTIRIYFPRFQSPVEEKSPGPPVEIIPGKGETILFAEDEEAIMRIGQSILEKMGYNVLTAGSPLEAIRLAQEHIGTIDLLITDVVMPEMNGKELSECLRLLHPEMKTLFMSGYTATIIADHGVKDEGTNFLPKPFSLHDLTAAIRKMLTTG